MTVNNWLTINQGPNTKKKNFNINHIIWRYLPGMSSPEFLTCTRRTPLDMVTRISKGCRTIRWVSGSIGDYRWPTDSSELGHSFHPHFWKRQHGPSFDSELAGVLCSSWSDPRKSAILNCCKHTSRSLLRCTTQKTHFA